MIRRHVTPALVAFSALLLSCLSTAWASHSWWIAAGAGLAFAAASPAFLGVRAYSRVGILLLSASLGCLLGAASQARMSHASVRSLLPMQEADISDFTGTVTQDSSLTQEDDTVLRLRLRDATSSLRGITAEARGNALLLIPGDYRFSIGEQVRVHAIPSRMGGIGPEQWVARARRAEVQTLGFGNALWAFRADARSWLHRAVSRVGYPASALLEALLVGAREDVPQDLHDGFKRTGSLHILALSGLHVTVLYGAAAGLLWFLRRRWQKFLAATLVIIFFQFLAGFMPSLLRATVMIIIGGIAVLLDRDREPINVLALSGIVLLLIDPWQAFTLSFQLSFLALAGILVIGSWYPSGLVAGIVLVPLTTAYLWAGLAWLPLSLVPWTLLHDVCAQAFGLFYNVIRECALAFSNVPGFSVPPSAVPWLAAGTGLAVLLAATVLPLKQGRA